MRRRKIFLKYVLNDYSAERNDKCERGEKSKKTIKTIARAGGFLRVKYRFDV